jgi:hypothetical protein
MIALPRALARRFRSVLRRCLAASESRAEWPLLSCRGDPDGLKLQAQAADVALRYCEPSLTLPSSVALVFPASVLTEVEGRTDEPVELEAVDSGKGRARWTDGGAPRTLDFELAPSDRLPVFPGLPKRFTPMPPSFATALHEAVRTTASQSARLALSRVQMRGKDGALVATDGKQLLIQGGFPFPWTDTVLVPRLPVFGNRELTSKGPVTMGRTKEHVVLRVGGWSFALTIDTQGRFPHVETVIPKPSRIASRLTFDAEDAAFLSATLPKLPGRDAEHGPVTLELSASPAVRACDEGGRVTEVVLARSTASGPAVRLCTDRRLLQRALQLGFREIQVATAESPLLSRDEQRVMVWMPLDPKAALPPRADALRLQPEVAPPTAPSSRSERRTPMPPPVTNNHPPDPEQRNGTAPERWGIDEIIAEAEALRSLLQDAAGRTARLLTVIKQQRRHSRVLRTAIDSLRELQLGP